MFEPIYVISKHLHIQPSEIFDLPREFVFDLTRQIKSANLNGSNSELDDAIQDGAI